MKSTLYRFPDGLYWIPDTSPPKAKYGTGPFASHQAAYLWWCCRVEEKLDADQTKLWGDVMRQLGDKTDAALLMGILDRIVLGERREIILKMARRPIDRRSLAAGDRP